MVLRYVFDTTCTLYTNEFYHVTSALFQAISPQLIPTWFEESHLVKDYKNEIEKEINDIIDKNLTNDDDAKMLKSKFEFVPVSILGRNKWRNSVESNEKVVIRI